jgi:DNA-binding response OmpR family regulator
MTDAAHRDVTVLIVDDDSDVVALYEAWLADSYEVRCTTSGDEALGALDESVDVVLLDRRTPGITGEDVLETVRDRGIDCRVAMITAVEPDSDIVDAPIDEYLLKPVDEHDLTTTVDILQRRQRYDEKSREFFSIAAKRAAIESVNGDRGDRHEYRKLGDRMEELRESIDRILEKLGPEGYEAAFRELD